MTIELVRLAEVAPVPWKNGAGVTQNLWTRSGAAGQIHARISIAEVTGSQTFSNFPGMDRLILQLDGPDVTLSIDGIVQPLTTDQPVAFPGEASVHSVAAGPGIACDLNLIWDRSRFSGAMRVLRVQPETVIFAEPDRITAILALEPLGLNMPKPLTLAPRDLYILDEAVPLVCQNAADIVLMILS